MRTIYKSEEFKKFYDNLNDRTKKRVIHILGVIENQRDITNKVTKKIIGSEFYELRIHSDNAYRVIIFTMDNENINNATKIVLLNGFMKKSNNYTKPINQARTIIENFMKYEYEQ